jgi:hypothetical protein
MVVIETVHSSARAEPEPFDEAGRLFKQPSRSIQARAAGGVSTRTGPLS